MRTQRREGITTLQEPLLGNIKGTLRPMDVLTKQQWIATWARENPRRVFTPISHLIDNCQLALNFDPLMALKNDESVQVTIRVKLRIYS
jgi:hypothetical protein